MPNRLKDETSPYLLQHRDNPVDWHPWGPEALEKAKAEDKPILLSIGYSACHWCHVMAHESFETPAIAALMNEHFVNVKVDREERPELDHLYMTAVQAMTGQGGWPLTVFLTPDGRPFYGGTYFPPEDAFGRPGFPTVLAQLAKAHRERRAEVEASGEQFRAFLNRRLEASVPSTTLNTALLDNAAHHLRLRFDPVHGGFGGPPKFPPSLGLELLLRDFVRTGNAHDRDMVEATLDRMHRGGLYDHLGGGFHRYAVDAEWRVPHFEKMLYDNALLSRLYLIGYQAFERPDYREVVEETLDWVVREMRASEGGFYSSLDADTEGEEGKFYVWTPDEVRAVVGPGAAAVFELAYDVTPKGNFEGKSVLNLRQPIEAIAPLLGYSIGQLNEELTLIRARLFDARAERVAPGRDDKILTAWNGMMLRAFAEAARVLDRADYREVALLAAEFLLSRLQRDGLLLRSYKDGVAKLNAYLEDYANLIDGLLSLYEATFDPHWIEEAKRLADTMIAEFWDPSLPGFYDVGKHHEALVAQARNVYDNATPSGNSVACDVLLRLSAYLGDEGYRSYAMQAMEGLSGVMAKYPDGFARLLCALDFALAPTREVAIVGSPSLPDTCALVKAAFSRYAPHQLVAAAPQAEPGPIVFLRDRPAIDGKPTAYVCEGQTCGLPLTDPQALAQEVSR
ncbi:thioredoxin domain-containing protein [bacterium]|nr:thioredoxin domain-containing protein [bacterium]